MFVTKTDIKFFCGHKNKMTTKTYNNNNGKYQDRAEYYYTQMPQEFTPIDNKYLDVYRNALTFYANVHHFGIRFFEKNNVLFFIYFFNM